MPFLPALALIAAVTATIAHGDVVVHRDGSARIITRGGGNSDAAVSPDGTRVAFVHEDATGDDARTSLWIASVAGGPPRRLLAPHPADEPEQNLASFANLRWSLDGGFIYVDADAWATSTAVHQVDVRTGAQRFVVDGWNLGVIRNGPWRGFLLVGQHRYYNRPEGGSYNPVSVVRPDGKAMLRVPGSEADDGEQSVARWLRSHGWSAS